MKTIRGFFRGVSNRHFVAALLVLLLPVYPTIGNSLILTNTASAQEDTQSITLAEYDSEDYQEEAQSSAVTGQKYIRANDPSVSSYSATNLTRLHVHKISKTTTLQEIAATFRIPVSMLIWANNFDPSTETLEAGAIIKIPPVSGASYVIQEGDTLETIAQKYGVSTERILSDYGQSVDEVLPVGEVVIVAGATQPVIIAEKTPDVGESAVVQKPKTEKPAVVQKDPQPTQKPVTPKPTTPTTTPKKTTPTQTPKADTTATKERTYTIRSTPGGIK